MDKMANYNFVVQNIKCYEINKNSLWLSIVYNKLWNTYSLEITRKFRYTNDIKIKEGFCSTYLNLIAAKAFVNQLRLAYQSAKNFQDYQGVKFYNIFYLIP